jgi:alkylated DNA nucleotide flippase Atl1
MDNMTKFRVQVGALVFEMEGSQDFVQSQLDRHRDRIETILKEQARIIKSGKLPLAAPGRGRGRRGRRRGRPPTIAAKGQHGRRPGRQPIIIRESSLTLKARQLNRLKKFLVEAAKGGKLGKDATVFAIAYFLCNQVLMSDKFSAGDVIAAYGQVGSLSFAPAPRSVDVVQMLRNLAAASIGKEWVVRNADGTFSLTAKGKQAGASGQIVRPRGRRPKAGWADPGKRPAASPPTSRTAVRAVRAKTRFDTLPVRVAA